jgi:hypothetical protein
LHAALDTTSATAQNFSQASFQDARNQRFPNRIKLPYARAFCIRARVARRLDLDDLQHSSLWRVQSKNYTSALDQFRDQLRGLRIAGLGLAVRDLLQLAQPGKLERERMLAKLVVEHGTGKEIERPVDVA